MLTKEDYAELGRVARREDRVCRAGNSWQAKAEQAGWNEEHAVLKAQPVLRTTHACTLVNPAERRRDQRIDQMLAGYLEAALWSSGEVHPQTGEQLENLREFDVSTEGRDVALAYCTAFYDKHAIDLGAYADIKTHAPEHTAYECIGHDLWLTACGSGVGFWDRGMGRVGERLTQGAEDAGEKWATLGDDLFVHFSG